MKVIHFGRSDSGYRGGGAAVSMCRLNDSLRAAGVDSKILCQFKTTQSSHVQVLQRPQSEILDKILKQITSRLGLNDIHRISSFKIKQHKDYINTDIVHLHSTHSGFLNYLALPTLTVNKPAVFTLKDMWALTGHCGYSFDCDRWKIGCGKCPHLDTHPTVKRDATRLEWKLKNWIYSQSKLTIVCPSQWMAEKAKQSPLMRHFPIHVIPHGVNTEIFQPLDSQQCRAKLGIPLNKKVLLFSAIKLSDYRKGGDLLIQALQSLPESLKVDTVLLVIGNGEATAETVGIPTYELGYLNDDSSKAIAYSAADLCLFPTRDEVFGNVSIESQACGTPVVSFRVGGVPEHVRPGTTGYLAESANAKDFCNGIVQLLEDEPLRSQMSQQCRTIALNEYNLKLYAQRHIRLYQTLISQKIAAS